MATRRLAVCSLVKWVNIIVYYIKVNGIPSGNKLIKMIQYPQPGGRGGGYSQKNWAGVCSLLPKTLTHRKMFRNVCLAFGTILENFRKSSESGRKSSEKHPKDRHRYIYIIKRTLRVSLKILFLSLEHKIHIFSPPCNILFIASFQGSRKVMQYKGYLFCLYGTCIQKRRSLDLRTEPPCMKHLKYSPPQPL